VVDESLDDLAVDREYPLRVADGSSCPEQEYRVGESAQGRYDELGAQLRVRPDEAVGQRLDVPGNEAVANGVGVGRCQGQEHGACEVLEVAPLVSFEQVADQSAPEFFVGDVGQRRGMIFAVA
jgi:hypothetical protein